MSLCDISWFTEVLKTAHWLLGRPLFFTPLRMVLSFHTSLPSLLCVQRGPRFSVLRSLEVARRAENRAGKGSRSPLGPD